MMLFTPGPIAMDEETLAEGGKQAQYFRTPEFSALMLDSAAMLRTALDAPDDARTVFLTAGGTAAMEASVMNLFGPEDRVLVINGGTFGRRFKAICEIHRVPFESIDLEWNEAFRPEVLERFENRGITGLLVNVCETSTGQLYPMDSISAFCRRNGVCLVVDAISSFLCDPFSMKESGAAAVIVSSQKGLALHPGMSFVAVTKETFDERCAKREVRSLYFNFAAYVKDMERGQTPYTPAVGIVNQLHEKLGRITETGVSASVTHIAGLAGRFREKLLSETSFTVPDYPLSNCLTPVYCADRDAEKVAACLKDRHGVFVTPCAGDIAPFLFRVAHMSMKLTEADVDELAGLLKAYGEGRK